MARPKKLAMNGQKPDVASSHNECAGVPSNPSRHESEGAKSLPEATWKTPAQLAADKILAAWLKK